MEWVEEMLIKSLIVLWMIKVFLNVDIDGLVGV